MRSARRLSSVSPLLPLLVLAAPAPSAAWWRGAGGLSMGRRLRWAICTPGRSAPPPAHTAAGAHRALHGGRAPLRVRADAASGPGAAAAAAAPRSTRDEEERLHGVFKLFYNDIYHVKLPERHRFPVPPPAVPVLPLPPVGRAWALRQSLCSADGQVQDRSRAHPERPAGSAQHGA